MWKVRQLADSKILIKEETIFTLKAGTGRLALGEQLYGDKSLTARACSSGCCVLSLSCLTSKPVPIALRRHDGQRDAAAAGKR
jgi:UPF0755 protein